MMAALILWSHALAALLFGAVGLATARLPRDAMPRRALVIAFGATALWALAIAGNDAQDFSISLAHALRDVAWLGFMLVLVKRNRAAGYSLGAVYAVVMGLALADVVLASLASAGISTANTAMVTAVRQLFAVMTDLSALILVQQLAASIAARARGGLWLIALALATMWGADLAIGAARFATSGSGEALLAGRGLVMAVLGLVMWVATHQRDDWQLSISRPAAMQTLGVIALALYAGLIALIADMAGVLGGTHARIAETAVVFGATAALLTLLSTPWLRAWAKVKVAKHLFSHRYDYRSEWQRFSETLGQPGDGAEPLATRVVKAMADLTVSPAGALLAPEGTALCTIATWRWDEGLNLEGTRDLAAYLQSGRIVDLDAVRALTAPPAELDAVPAALLADAETWVIVPLLHVGSFVGAVLLARPPVQRALDWEDFDLLRVAGRQAASCLAEDRAHAALADAQRFDEFNRRFAFIMHDIKNLASQLSLVARNAERHADNPAFRADMVATLSESSARMAVLLARLSQQGGGRAEPLQPTDIAALLARVAAARRGVHAIVVESLPALALANPARLEAVLGHLVQNAVEASAPGAPVRLTAGTRAGDVVIEVIDEGVGMGAAFIRDQLFRPFASTKPTGFGIGAFEARQLVDAMGGRIEVTSREGEGTCFRIILPAANAMEVAA